MVPTKNNFKFYTAVPGFDFKKSRPSDWIFIKMSADNHIVYSPIQPFILTEDPAAQFVQFTDYEPADKRNKFKKLRTLREINPGSWPAEPTPAQSMIATKIDLEAIDRLLDEEEEERIIKEEKKEAVLDDTIKKHVEAAVEKLKPTPTKIEKPEEKKPKSEDEIRKEVAAEYEERARRQRQNQRYYRSPDRSRHYDDRRRRSPSPRRKPENEVMEVIRQGFDKLAKTDEATTEQKILRQQQEQLALLQQQQQQIQMQQQQLQMMKPAHRAFGVPSPDLAKLLPHPDSYYRGPVAKRHSLDRSLEYSAAEVTPERTRKMPAQPYQRNPYEDY